MHKSLYQLLDTQLPGSVTQAFTVHAETCDGQEVEVSLKGFVPGAVSGSIVFGGSGSTFHVPERCCEAVQGGGHRAQKQLYEHMKTLTLLPPISRPDFNAEDDTDMAGKVLTESKYERVVQVS